MKPAGMFSGPLTKAVASQVLAMAAVLAALNLGLFGQMPSIWLLVVAQSLVAAGIARLMKSDRWWLVIHAAFPIAVALASQWQLHSGWYLAGFVLLLLIFGPTVRNRVPLYLSNQKTAQVLSEFLHQQVFTSEESKTILDVGSGTGTMVKLLAAAHPLQSVHGIEGAWIPYLMSRVSCASLPNATLMRGDFWAHRFAPYPAVYAFLSTEPMTRLWQKASSEMAPGSFLISNSFQVPGVTPHTVLLVDDDRQTELFVYKI